MPEKSVGKARSGRGNPPAPTRSNRELACAGGVLLGIAVCGGTILWVTEGFLNKGYGVAFFVCAALFAGIGFWAFTPSSDDKNNFKSAGVRLVGGAAVGLVFSWIAWKLVDDLPQYVVVQLPSEVKTEGLHVQPGQGVRQAETFLGRDGALLYVVFDGNEPRGTLTLRWFEVKSETAARQRTLVVDRRGVFAEQGDFDE